ncbi:MAG: hypothetical protein M3501_10775 [Actinomycetota bacterium]|nr:hypothetical protein [Actinomycetota bacterium]
MDDSTSTVPAGMVVVANPVAGVAVGPEPVPSDESSVTSIDAEAVVWAAVADPDADADITVSVLVGVADDSRSDVHADAAARRHRAAAPAAVRCMGHIVRSAIESPT